jgi:hypothetical protein
LLVEAAEIASAEPAVAECLRIGFRIVVITSKDGEPAHTNFARFARRKFATAFVLNRNLDSGALETASADPGFRPVFRIVQISRQNSDIAGHLSQAEILDQNFSEFGQGALLILAIHRGAGIDHIAQRRAIVFVGGRMLGEHFQDRGHSEDIGHAPALDQPPRLFGIEPIA